MTEIVMLLILFGIPICFIISLVRLIKCPKMDIFKKKRIILLITTIILGLLTFLIIGFIIMLSTAINHM